MRLVWGQRPLTASANRPMRARRHHGVWHFAYGARKEAGQLDNQVWCRAYPLPGGSGPMCRRGIEDLGRWVGIARNNNNPSGVTPKRCRVRGPRPHLFRSVSNNSSTAPPVFLPPSPCAAAVVGRFVLLPPLTNPVSPAREAAEAEEEAPARTPHLRPSPGDKVESVGDS